MSLDLERVLGLAVTPALLGLLYHLGRKGNRHAVGRVGNPRAIPPALPQRCEAESSPHQGPLQEAQGSSGKMDIFGVIQTY